MGISFSCCHRMDNLKNSSVKQSAKTMGESVEEKLSGFLKRYPHIVERYIKENCTKAQLADWLEHVSKRTMDEEVQTTTAGRADGEVRSVVAPPTYHPLRSSILLSMQLLRATKLGKTNRELIFSDMTASIREIVPVDGTNLYLREPNGQRIYLQPANQPIRGLEEGCTAFHIQSRDILACYAAESMRPVCSSDIPKDIRIEQISVVPLPNAKHVIAHPILNAAEDLVGVIELYRASTRRPFTASEKQLVSMVVHWAQLVLESDEKLVASEKAQRLGDFILEVIRNLFSRIKNMDNVIKAIMEHAKQLVNAERVTLFLVDQKKNELYSSILDMGNLKSANFVHDENAEIRLPLGEGIAGAVAQTGEPIRTNDAYSDPRFCRKVDETYNQVTKSMIAMPLSNGKEVVGVIEMLNKHHGVFTEEDENLLKVYSIYCGLAINVARMYDRIYRSDKKYRVALEVLTYHSCVSEADAENALPCVIPDTIAGITSHDFSPWDVEEEREVSTVLYMMYDLAGKLLLDKATLVRFVLTVRKNYRPVAYHNWDHGFSVAHSMYFLLKVGENHFSLLEKICLFIAALCHDLDHRGYDNRFMKKFSTPLASLYSSSPMEHHHFNMTITILQQRDHNIFRYFKNASYRNILGIIKHAILSTDLATFWASKSKLESYLDSERGLDWTDHEQRMSVVGIAMPTCDLCAMYKPWDIQVKVVMLIMKEFWAQGDQEKASDSKPLSLMDRDEAAQLAGGQVGFIRALCLPCYTTIVRVFPQMQPIVDEVSNNLAQWEVISKQPYEERERILEEQMQQKFRKIEGRMKQ
ncbi:Phosphodiesterase [Paragonimus heterotremus]|uniref:Phosphodiesterase n=1 Tax=Paragonimus heterotremus TaxID=100268 RepID=A0A8J4WJ20_9TREM|nr:Phosphodiesterase [Paragonimus heterotremus]